ncbi:MAG: WD40/YVTN/BNR-like repeat-containing protein [Acidimicrobiales bacterium]
MGKWLAVVLVALSAAACSAAPRRALSSARSISTSAPTTAEHSASRSTSRVATASRVTLHSLVFINTHDGLTATSAGIYRTSDGGQSWTNVEHRPATRIDLVGTTGLAIAGPDLVHTNDAGRSWQPSPSPPAPLTSLDMLSPDLAWATTTSGELATTVDAGKRWGLLPLPDPVGSVCFADQQLGWAAGESVVLGTTNAGRSWSVLYRLPGTMGASDVVHCSGDEVWVLFRGDGAGFNQNYSLVRSSDGGKHWGVLAHNSGFAPEPFLPGVATAPGSALGDYTGPFALVAPGLAYFVGQCPACYPQGVSLVRVSSRQAWVTTPIAPLDGANIMPEPTVVAISFVDPDHGWVGANRFGGGFTIAVTSDGGTSWALLAGPP